MNGQLGYAGVVLGFVAASGGAVTLALGLRRRRPYLLAVGRNFAWILLGGAVLAVIFMERALITRDFTIEYVAQNGSSRTPALFNVATLWAALEGSILLWTLVLAGYVVVTVHKFRDRLTDPLVGWALLTMFVVAAFFFALMVGPANPFRSFSPPPGYDGPGPNPLLQNHILMAVHPPVLYLGYVGFTVPFAFAVAALATGRVGEGWLIETRRWTLFAWGFLSAGILLGAWWSYEVLGWGGYWAWDPVENASFLPWLTGTAYLHSVMVQERRGMLRVWNLSLLCATFSLTILGTFLTRSGVLDSVHAFTESAIGPALLGFFTVVVVVVVGLIGWRGDRLRAPGRLDSALSREAAFLMNNLVFAGFAFIVLLGTVWPLVVEAISGSRISTGRPFFDFWAQPIGLTLLFLMAVAPVLPWRKTRLDTLAERLLWPAWAGAAVLVVAVALGARGLTPLLAFGLGGFAAGSAVRQIVLASRRQGWRGFVGRANGGMVVHIGVIIIGVAVAASGSYSTEQEVRLAPGESASIAGHTLTYLGSATEDHSEKVVVAARVRVDDDGVYEPALNTFKTSAAQASGEVIGTPSVRAGLTDDVYLALLAPPGEGDEVALRVIVLPLATWLWIGGGVIVAGTVLAAWPGRRRQPTEPVSAPVAVGEPAARAGRAGAGRTRGRGVMEGLSVEEAAAGDPDSRPRRVRWTRWAALAVGLLLLLFAWVLFTREPAQNRLADSPLIDEVAPPLVGPTLEGGRFDLDDQRGRWVLVNFFATWCAPCRQEHPELVSFDQRHGQAGDVEVVSVVYGDEPADVQEFFDENGGEWPVVVGDGVGQVSLDYGVAGVPESFLVDPLGFVRAKVTGGVTSSGLDAILARLESQGL